MKSSYLIDGLLAAVLLPLWIGAFALHVDRVADGRLAWPGFWVETTESGDAPVVRALWPGTLAAQSGLQVGDRLLRVGDVPLEHEGPVGVFAQTLAVADANLTVPLRYERDGTPGEITLALTPIPFPWRAVPVTVGFVIAGSLVLLRRRGTRLGRAFFVAAMVYGLHWTFFFGGGPEVTYGWLAVFALSSVVLYPLMLRPIFVILHDNEAGPEKVPAWIWVFSIFGPVSTGWVVGIPFPPVLSLQVTFAITFVWLATVLFVLTQGYRRARPRGRRQLRWVVLGLYLGMAPLLAAAALIAVRPELWWLHDVANLATVLIPICFFVAIVRFNAFDVDRLILSTTAYSILSIVLIAGLLTVVPWLAEIASAVLGTSATQSQISLSAIFAAGVVPGQRVLKPHIERVFFSERHALEQGVDDLLQALDGCETPEALPPLLGRRLYTLLLPEGCVVFGALEQTAAPVYQRGRFSGGDAPAQFSLESLETAKGGIDLTEKFHAESEDLAALAELGATLVFAIRRSGRVAAVLALGAKRSGDVYSTTDKALLRAVAEKTSDVLQRFDEAEILQQERAMRDSFRRYVPSSVADHLAAGEDIEGGERELSVLFADVRGYSTYSEGKEAEAIFSVVNELTEAISSVIRQHDGTVVEFLGDGVMAVFGAPNPNPAHARSAVQAGCSIVSEIDRLELGGGNRAIQVGVGIATGRVFIGNVETKERLIYTAIGDTVNVASRLQDQTRDLEAAVAIDGPTFDDAGDATTGFEPRGEVPIRGRKEQVSVYALPLDPAA
ncbi:MAG: adenylate/guanylate cyclase domain-containing protein [Candidatus Binatia bacterium]|nr:adenylate/guanylate cyclase domain-containing protein [Candidatus Binatia bacterium]